MKVPRLLTCLLLVLLSITVSHRGIAQPLYIPMALADTPDESPATDLNTTTPEHAKSSHSLLYVTSSIERTAERSNVTQVKGWHAEYFYSKVYLTWSTPQELGIREFKVERTTDGKNFIPVGTVRSQGNSIQAQYYDLIDHAPVNGSAYYCLTSTDANDKTMCWGFVEITLKEQARLRVWPNPATKDHMNIVVDFLHDKTVDWQVLDLKGQRVAHGDQAAVTDGQFVLDLSQYDDITSGLYILNIQGTQDAFSKKIMVQE